MGKVLVQEYNSYMINEVTWYAFDNAYRRRKIDLYG